jgi:hypothetical protein
MKNSNPFLYFWSVFLLLLFITLFSGCKDRKKNEIVIIPDAQKTHLQSAHLFGKIKIIKTLSFNTRSKDSLDYKHLVSIVLQHFSSDGYLLNLVVLNRDNDTVRTRTIKYNDEGKELEWSEFDRPVSTKSFCKYKYDINGMISTEEYYIQDTLFYSIQYKTDGIGNIIELNKKKNDILIKNLLAYNASGLLVKNSEYDPNSKLFKYIVYEYDNYGDEVNKKVYNNFNQMVEFTYTQYDQKGRVLKIVYENLDHGLKDTQIYTKHDQNKNWNFELQISNNDTLFFRKRDITYY